MPNYPEPDPGIPAMKVYVAGPYSKGDVVINTRQAILAADELLEAGHHPYVPHLTHFWHLVAPRTWNEWLDLDLVWLRECDAVLRLPGESTGADMETAEAHRLSIPVFGSVGELLSATRGVSDV